MSPSTAVLAPSYVYLATAIASTAWLVFGQMVTVGKHRKLSGIQYPQLYAEKAEALASPAAHTFNCAQRAHQNTLENLPVILIGTLTTALKYPTAAAGLCGLWSFARVLYTIGYITGDPQKRLSRGGFLGQLALTGLLGSSMFTIGALLLETL